MAVVRAAATAPGRTGEEEGRPVRLPMSETVASLGSGGVFTPRGGSTLGIIVS